jgi:hypothetical protein
MITLLQNAIENKQAKEFYGAYIIYPRRFSNMNVLDALLISLKTEYNFFKIMDSIKAIKKAVTK